MNGRDNLSQRSGLTYNSWRLSNWQETLRLSGTSSRKIQSPRWFLTQESS